MSTADLPAAASHLSRTAPGIALLDVATSEDFFNSLAVRANGSINVVGLSVFDGPPRAAATTEVRLNADGRVSTGFGEDGRAALGASGYRVTVLPDDTTLALQSNAGSESWDLSVLRFAANGTPDASYAANSRAAIPDDYDPDLTHLHASPDGTLLVSSTTTGRVELLRLKADGTADATFGEQGIVGVDQTVTFAFKAFTLPLENGQYLLGGDLFVDGTYRPGLVRVNADGTLDTAFGEQGRVVFDARDLADFRGALAVQNDGKIVIAGSNPDEAFSVVRLDPDGSKDTGFGAGGVATVNPQGSAHFAYAVTAQADGQLLLGGDTQVNGGSDYAVVRLTADGQLDTTFASPDGRYHLDGSRVADDVQGLAEGETLRGLEGDDLLQGNGGRDVLVGGEGADIFRFASVEDSYRSVTQNAADRIRDFDPTEDRIDLIALGFAGLGDGREGTLAIQTNAEGTRTYLKSFEADADGHRFELVLEGDFSGALDSNTLIFAPVLKQGTAGNDRLNGTVLPEVLEGLAGNDRLDAGASNDVLVGGSGRDRLVGGEGEDVFRFVALEDSYRTASTSAADLIIDYVDGDDRIDLSALGFTGLGDGTADTLQVSYSATLDRTYLKNFQVDGAGHRFEVSLAGNHGLELDDSDFLFAATAFAEPRIEMLGIANPVG